jgi:hypothetical protein
MVDVTPVDTVAFKFTVFWVVGTATVSDADGNRIQQWETKTEIFWIDCDKME